MSDEAPTPWCRNMFTSATAWAPVGRYEIGGSQRYIDWSQSVLLALSKETSRHAQDS